MFPDSAIPEKFMIRYGINVCGSLNCSFIMVYAMLTTFITQHLSKS